MQSFNFFYVLVEWRMKCRGTGLAETVASFSSEIAHSKVREEKTRKSGVEFESERERKKWEKGIDIPCDLWRKRDRRREKKNKIAVHPPVLCPLRFFFFFFFYVLWHVQRYKVFCAGISVSLLSLLSFPLSHKFLTDSRSILYSEPSIIFVLLDLPQRFCTSKTGSFSE